jgi:type I restriction enzyme, S subunit
LELITLVATRTREAESAIGNQKREISLLREYRTRLITDVVTGKLDVREAAALLPKEPDDADPKDEVEAPDEIDEMDSELESIEVPE